LIGAVIDGTYEVVRLLGEGGMGAIYEARHLGTGRRVAVKVIGAQALAVGKEAFVRFEREARASGAIDSEHVVQVLDSGIDAASGNPYMVMELLAGEDLHQLLQRTGPLSPEVALRVIAQACIGLQKAHSAGIVHRDLKAANLYLARRDHGGVTVKLLDFGIAKMRADQYAASDDHGLTRTGAMIGSPLYMSPEQAKGSKDIDHRSDVWSLGVVMYEALAGSAPNASLQSIGELIIAICSTPPRPIQEVAPWVPAEVAAIVHTALSADPAGRFPTAADMHAAIAALLPNGAAVSELMLLPVTPEVRRTTAPRLAMTTAGVGQIVGATTAVTARPKRRWLVPVMLAGVAAAAAVGFFAVQGAESPPKAATATLPSPAPVPSPPPVAPVDPNRTVEVSIAPADATIEIDGKAAIAHDGKLELRGAVGSVYHVRVEQAGRSTTSDVVIAESGPVPPRIELAPVVTTTATTTATTTTTKTATHKPGHTPATTSPATKKTSPTIDRSFD
jgi:serine/threonine-protein kinase